MMFKNLKGFIDCEDVLVGGDTYLGACAYFGKLVTEGRGSCN